MQVIYHEWPEPDYPFLPRAVMNAEEMRQEQESACRLFISVGGAEIMLVADCDGRGRDEVLAFANKHTAGDNSVFH